MDAKNLAQIRANLLNTYFLPSILKDQLNRTIKQLKRLQEDGPENPLTGICGNCVSLSLEIRRELCPLWPYYSGNPVYPVPIDRKATSADVGDDEYDAPNHYYHLVTHAARSGEKNYIWNRQRVYGKLRWSLVEFLLNACEELVNDIDNQ